MEVARELLGAIQGAPNLMIGRRPSWTRKWQALDPASIASRGANAFWQKRIRDDPTAAVPARRRAVRLRRTLMVSAGAIGRRPSWTRKSRLGADAFWQKRSVSAVTAK